MAKLNKEEINEIEEFKIKHTSGLKFLRNFFDTMNLMPSERTRCEQNLSSLSIYSQALEKEISDKDRRIKLLEGTISQYQEALEEQNVDRKAPEREEVLIKIIENCRNFFSKIYYPHLIVSKNKEQISKLFFESNRAIELYRRDRTIEKDGEPVENSRNLVKIEIPHRNHLHNRS